MASQLLEYRSLCGTGFGNWFHTKHLRLRLLHHPFALLLNEGYIVHCNEYQYRFVVEMVE